MSEDTLNAAIAAKWESAGLDASNDGTEVGTEEPVAEVTDDTETEVVDDTPADDAVVDDDVETVVDDAAETDTETETAEVDTATEAAAEATTKAAEEVKEAQDELAEALGLGKPPADPKKRAAWWKSRLAYSQVHKVVTEREKKLNETHTGALKQQTDRITEYDTRFADVKKVEDIITNSPEQYVKTLSSLFPDTYGKMFAPLLGEGKAAAELLVEKADPGPKPEPDYKLPDGNMTYSVEGYDKLMAWQQKVTEQNMLQRFKPHMDFVQSQQKEAEKQQKIQLAEQTKARGLEASKKALAEVETWDLGKENINEILEAAAKLDSSYDAVTALNIAYRQIVVPKLKANRDVMQAQILKDMKKKSAKQTSAALTQSKTNAPAVVAAAASTNVDDRIKAAWKRQGLI
jgi:hypothetical protein